MKIITYFFNFLIIFLLFININCQFCLTNRNIDNSQCFNNVLYFDIDNKHYRAGHFAINSKGDIIIEYSYLQYRLFYGLTKDGKTYFPNITKEIEITSDTIESYVIRRYESINYFVSLMNDINKEKEYLMSISSYITILEIYDLENDFYDISEAVDFVNKPAGIYSYVFQVLELEIDNKMFYFCIYIYKIGDNNGSYRYIISLKKFGFSNYFLNSTIYENPIVVSYTPGNRITSSIILDYYNLLSIFYMNTDGYFYAILYDYNLESKSNIRISQFTETITSVKDGVFFKSLYLFDEYIAFIYFYNNFNFRLNILNLRKESDETYSFITKLEYSESDISFKSICTMNEFIKIDNDRLVLVSIENNSGELYFIFFDLFNDLHEIKVRYYKYNFINDKIGKFDREISASIYNGFIIFTGTVLPQNYENDDDFFSILLLFGYPNGTDYEIDIFPYLIDTNHYNRTNILCDKLLKDAVIENNIFGYELMEQIKLIFIPDEIIFINMIDNSSISENGYIDINSLLKQNEDILKENKYYFIEYQFLIKEPDYSLFYNNYPDLVNGSSSNLNEYFIPKILGGRINTLKFKLCHNYCKSCKKFGYSEIEQKCEECLDEYSYFNIDQVYHECIPEGFYLNIENNSIEQCTQENSKYYIDIENNKKICIKNDYECPTYYRDYNETSKECKYSKIKESPSILQSDKIYQNNEQTSKNDFQSSERIINNIETEREHLLEEESILITYSNLFLTNEDIIKKMDTVLLLNYTIWEESIEIKGENNTIFQLTSTINELRRLLGNSSNQNGVSIIDLGTCENLLKDTYNIDHNISLIIKKYEKLTNAAERNVQYEVYHPLSKEKLNLSLCESETISLYIPITLNEKLVELYKDLQNSGYDLFNIKDPFYNDICSPYKSENGTDVLLSDRKNDYYNNNYTTCQSNCQYSSFNSEYKFLKCECKVIVDDIDINDFDKFSEKIYKNFYDILKNSNYKTMKCYKLVFNSKYLKKNIGNFIVLSFFILYLISFVFFIIKGISPLQEQAINIIHSKFKDINIDDFENILIHKVKNLNNKGKEKIIEFPPKKKKKIVKFESNLTQSQVNKKKGANTKFNKRKKNNNVVKSLYIDKSSTNEKKTIMTETKKSILEPSELNKIKLKNKLKKEKVKKNDNKINDDNINNSEDILDDLDLNNLTYKKALESDKRSFIQIYWSNLKNKHLIIYTFFSFNDHNLIYIKISRFFFLICTSMAINVMFFFDSSMHKIYLDYGKYNFIKQIPQILYSSIVSLVIEILIGLLSSTGINIYQIRQIKEFNSERIKKIFKLIKIKLIIFFAVTLILFLFYWYLISSFCAVYNNTQTIYIKDFATSFALGLLYPFVIQLFLAFLRLFSLRKDTKFRGLLYKVC